MKRTIFLGILCLLSLFPSSLKGQQAVPNAPFVVQPASFFQPFYANAPFYIQSPTEKPAFVPNLPYNPLAPPAQEVIPPEVPTVDSNQVNALLEQIQQLKDEVQ